ncbi:tetratricopeptide repeat protein [Agrilutibacter solisilvae]|uniref:Tetratricopeptide repeat protein n=1 Tax=Agrilutibacter solisilvae TaxID=2763317 RepID=A0A974XY91_9GAMM|nr:tetratricopeptide repeat protein [Lysobacter solisilvae]QSX77909.1 tetratricopeptide repeat protein [Lysobacter solisilvae]
MNVKNRRLTASLRIGALANAVLGCLGFAFTASAMQPPAHADHALGTVHFPVSCTPPAQRDFDHALALLHHMTYPQARTAFAELAAREPDCAMAHWGVAMTLFQPLWPTRPTAADLARGAAEVEAARAAGRASEGEKLAIDAAAAFFDNAGQPDYWERIRRWEAAMQRAHAALPEDPELTVFYALAHLAVAPSNQNARANADRAAALLLPVYGDNPDHPGAMHYLVHANDVPGREHELLQIVRKYETVAPDNPHALHMPTHIYTRLGEWPSVIRGNLRAADAALKHPAGDQGQYVWDEFAHAIEYLVYAHLQQGDDDAALAQVRRLQAQARIEPSFKSAFHLSSTAARYALERGDWASAAQLPVRMPDTIAWDKYPSPEAVTWFARGLGAARQGQAEGAKEPVARLTQLEAASQASGEDLFARSIRVLRLAVQGWQWQAQGEPDRARKLLEEAAALEAATPKHAVTPGPTLPAEEQFGDLLMQQGHPAEALAAYQRALAAYPERFNAQLGATRAAFESGDVDGARRRLDHLLEVTLPGPRRRDAEASGRQVFAASKTD